MCPGVRKNSLMVLSHLILNDMMKVKGHIARLALCLQDDEPRIAALAQLFFHELSRKAYKVRPPFKEAYSMLHFMSLSLRHFELLCDISYHTAGGICLPSAEQSITVKPFVWCA